MNEIKWTVILFCIMITVSCLHVKDTLPSLQVVSYVDVNRYTGTWYEIARYPHTFQKGCIGSRATYALRDEGIFFLALLRPLLDNRPWKRI
jgi:apolipoprotein D and lipocalin family protein